MSDEKKYLDVGQLPQSLEISLTKSFEKIKELNLEVYFRAMGAMKQLECVQEQWCTDNKELIHPQTVNNARFSFGYAVINTLLTSVTEIAFNLEFIDTFEGKERMDSIIKRICEAQEVVMKIAEEEIKKQEKPKGSVH